jgi:hypothetical protein
MEKQTHRTLTRTLSDDARPVGGHDGALEHEFNFVSAVTSVDPNQHPFDPIPRSSTPAFTTCSFQLDACKDPRMSS